jgi:hypothetical protein
MMLRATSSLLSLALLTSAGCSDATNSGSDGGARDGGTRDLGSRDASQDGSVWARSGCKRGIAYGHHTVADLTAIQSSVAWWYNWADRPDVDLRDGAYRTAGVEYLPMIWGATFDADDVIANIPADTEWLLGFNEPNFGSQADISASAAAALWPEVERVADTLGLSIVSPAVNFCGGDCQDTSPFDYLDDFFAACDGCRVDAVAFHIYVGCNPRGTTRPSGSSTTSRPTRRASRSPSGSPSSPATTPAASPTRWPSWKTPWRTSRASHASRATRGSPDASRASPTWTCWATTASSRRSARPM